jgi:hypothetical protein
MSSRTISRLWLTNAVLAIAALLTSIYVGYRYVDLIGCLAEQGAASARRTASVAAATDAERVAELRMLQNPSAETRAATITAYEVTAKIRAANPAPSAQSCG